MAGDDTVAGPDKELLRGTLELIVLSIIAARESYGYAIITTIKERTHGQIDLKEGSLYPVLYRLEDSGSIESVWHAEGRGVPRKYYRITQRGMEELARLRQEWLGYVKLVSNLIEGSEQNG